MDFGWAPHFGGFWIFPILCLLFMAVMMVACGGMMRWFGHGDRRGHTRETPRQILERRYANGEIGKDQYDAIRRDITD